MEGPLKDEVFGGRRIEMGDPLSLLELVNVGGHRSAFLSPLLQKLFEGIDIGRVFEFSLHNCVFLKRNETFGFGLIIEDLIVNEFVLCGSGE